MDFALNLRRSFLGRHCAEAKQLCTTLLFWMLDTTMRERDSNNERQALKTAGKKKNAIFLCIFAASGCLIPFLPLYFKWIHFTATQSALIIAAMPFAAAVFNPLVGYFWTNLNVRSHNGSETTCGLAQEELCFPLHKSETKMLVNCSVGITATDKTLTKWFWRGLQIHWNHVIFFSSQSGLVSDRRSRWQMDVSQDGHHSVLCTGRTGPKWRSNFTTCVESLESHEQSILSMRCNTIRRNSGSSVQLCS